MKQLINETTIITSQETRGHHSQHGKQHQKALCGKHPPKKSPNRRRGLYGRNDAPPAVALIT